MSSSVAGVIALVVGFFACVTDLRDRRIPNVLTFGAAIAGIAMHAMTGGGEGFRFASLGWLAGLSLFMPFFLLRGMGGGDVKLLAALGAWLGPRDVFWLAIYGSIAGGVMAVAVALAHGYLKAAFRNVRTLLEYWWLTGPRPMPGMTLERGDGPRMAYALPIFVGTAVTIWRG